MNQWPKAFRITNMVLLPIAAVCCSGIIFVISLLSVWSTYKILPLNSLWISLMLDGIVILAYLFYLFIRKQYIIIAVSYLLCGVYAWLLLSIQAIDKVIFALSCHIWLLLPVLFVVTTVNLILVHRQSVRAKKEVQKKDEKKY